MGCKLIARLYVARNPRHYWFGMFNRAYYNLIFMKRGENCLGKLKQPRIFPRAGNLRLCTHAVVKSVQRYRFRSAVMRTRMLRICALQTALRRYPATNTQPEQRLLQLQHTTLSITHQKTPQTNNITLTYRAKGQFSQKCGGAGISCMPSLAISPAFFIFNHDSRTFSTSF